MTGQVFLGDPGPRSTGVYVLDAQLDAAQRTARAGHLSAEAGERLAELLDVIDCEVHAGMRLPGPLGLAVGELIHALRRSTPDRHRADHAAAVLRRLSSNAERLDTLHAGLTDDDARDRRTDLAFVLGELEQTEDTISNLVAALDDHVAHTDRQARRRRLTLTGLCVIAGLALAVHHRRSRA